MLEIIITQLTVREVDVFSDSVPETITRATADSVIIHIMERQGDGVYARHGCSHRYFVFTLWEQPLYARLLGAGRDWSGRG